MGFLRGSTPTHRWNNIGIDLTKAKVYATYVQNKKVVIDKTNKDMTITQDSVSVHLTQKDTLEFKEGIVEIQFRYIFEDGTVGGSKIFKTAAHRILKDGEIVWE